MKSKQETQINFEKLRGALARQDVLAIVQAFNSLRCLVGVKRSIELAQLVESNIASQKVEALAGLGEQTFAAFRVQSVAKNKANLYKAIKSNQSKQFRKQDEAPCMGADSSHHYRCLMCAFDEVLNKGDHAL